MKTLDEVINELHYWDTCDEFPESFYDFEVTRDALHYLKEYKERQEMLSYWSEKAISEQHNLSDAITFMQSYREDKDDLTALRAYWKEQHENQPLTWDELKTMENKPVWVEHKHYSKWLIVYEVYENTIVLDGNGCYTQYFSDDNDKEVRWKAYRKERE